MGESFLKDCTSEVASGVLILVFAVVFLMIAGVSSEVTSPAWAADTNISRDTRVEKSKWFLYGYRGKWTDNRYGDILLRGRLEPRASYLWTLGGGRTLYRAGESLDLELEANVTRHTGMQDNFEFNAAVSVRWRKFPWDQFINTTVAHGMGPSVAFGQPYIERLGTENTDRMLVYLQTEVTFSYPGRHSRLQALLRLHHRSGGFGLLTRDSGSNFTTVGLRYRL